MASGVKQAVITAFLSRTRDRFHEYNQERTLEERLQLAAGIEGIEGIEVIFPYEVNDPTRLCALLQRHGLKLAAVNVNVKAEPEFRNGGLTSNDREIRAKAVRFITEAKAFAEAAGADKVTCCPLGDGYEFSFQCDYARSWKHLVESIGQAAEQTPQIPLFIEYKPSETRGKCFIDTASKALCLLNDIGSRAVGVTIDFGHSLYGNENPPEALCLLAESRFPYYVHINDNDARWDWDYFVGSKHFLAYVEFLYYLQEYGYDDFLTSDTSPTRWDIRGTFEANTRLTNKIWLKLKRLDRERLKLLIGGSDYLQTWRFIEEEIFSL